MPDAKDVAGTPGFGSSSALGVTGVMGHPGVAGAVAASAVCLVSAPDVGDRPRLPRRRVRDGADVSIGSASPYPAVHARAHRRSATLAHCADPGIVQGGGRARGLRVPDFVTDAELIDLFSGAGVRYRDAMVILSTACCPTEPYIVIERRQRRRSRHPSPSRSRDGGSPSHSAWAASSTASVPVSGWPSAVL